MAATIVGPSITPTLIGNVHPLSVVLHQVTSAAAVFTCSRRGHKMSCLLKNKLWTGFIDASATLAACCLAPGAQSIQSWEEDGGAAEKEVARINFTHNIHRNLVYRMPSAAAGFMGLGWPQALAMARLSSAHPAPTEATALRYRTRQRRYVDTTVERKEQLLPTHRRHRHSHCDRHRLAGHAQQLF